MNETRQLKTINNKTKFEPKMASPAKQLKCRYPFVEFTGKLYLQGMLQSRPYGIKFARIKWGLQSLTKVDLLDPKSGLVATFFFWGGKGGVPCTLLHPLLSKCKKSEKTSECQFTRKRVKTTQKQLLSTRKREKWEKKWNFSLEKEWKKSESEHEWTPLENVLSSV